MRSLAYHVVDTIVDHWEAMATLDAIRTVDPADLQLPLGTQLPREPNDPSRMIDLLAADVLPWMQHGGHPRYFARVPSPASFAGVMGDWLTTGFNAIAASWGGGSGPTAVELQVLSWLAEILGLPATSEGIFTSGGSLGNATALVAARSAGYSGTVFLTDQTHSCVPRDLRALGWSANDIHVLATDEQFRMDVGELRRLLDRPDRTSQRPPIVIATAGTTNSGAVDPLVDLADLQETHPFWLHVDAAYGGPSVLTNKGARLLEGIGAADSVTIDPHKWLFQPYDSGCVLVRHPGALEQAFQMNPEYLADVTSPEAVDLRNRGFELSRKPRALKLWLTFTTYGLDAIAKAIERGIENAEIAEGILRSDPTWDVVTPAQLGIVTFAHRDRDLVGHQLAVDAVNASGHSALSTTVLSGRKIFRLCTINPLTTREDLEDVIRLLRHS